MKIAILHDSQAGNGEKLAETMKARFEEAGAEVTMGHVTKIEASAVAAESPDLLVVGAAIRAFHTSPTSKKWLKDLSAALKAREDTIGHGAVFVTHGLPKGKAEGWGNRFRKRLARLPRVENVYPQWLSGRVTGQSGPLEEGTEERFRRYAEELMEWAGLKA